MVKDLTLGKAIDLIKEESKVLTETKYNVYINKDGKYFDGIIRISGGTQTTTVAEDCMEMPIGNIHCQYWFDQCDIHICLL